MTKKDNVATAELGLAKETKGTFRFEAEEGSEAYGVMRTAYVQKEAFEGNPAPEKIEVAITW